MTRRLIKLAVVIIGLSAGSGCAHIASSRATFTPTGDGLVLQIDRHMDELLQGPDIEEDQTLVLDLHDYPLGKWLAIPSPQAQARLEVRRFGPTSRGEVFAGWVRVCRVTDAKIVADLKLVVTARTANGNYVQTTKFKGQYGFFRAAPPD